MATQDDRPALSVRELRPDEMGIRVGYFRDATDEHLLRMGGDRALLPAPDEWLAEPAAVAP